MRHLVTFVLLMIGCSDMSNVDKPANVDTDTGLTVEIETDDTGITVVDQDQDGFAADQDCDDTDPDVHPDAEEVCDDVDQNCDGSVDEELMLTWHQDLDGDGFGRFKEVMSCSQDLDGYLLVSGDCDDGNSSIHPGMIDEPFDGIDQDCDGVKACEFEIRDANGRRTVVPNFPVLITDPNTPTGSQPTSEDSLLFSFTMMTAHPECPAITWDSTNFEIDFKVTQWSPTDIELYDLTVDPTTPIGGPVDAGGPWPNIVGMNLDSPEIEGPHQFALYANTTGAEGDSITVSIDGYSVRWSYMGVRVYGGVNDIIGLPIDF